jgi:hypothetical protein
MGKKSGSPQGDTTSDDVHSGDDQSPVTELRTVDEWRAAAFPADRRGPNREDWKHDVAAYVHRWASHAHHNSAPMQLSEKDYLAAIKAALEPNPRAHRPALFTLGGAD